MINKDVLLMHSASKVAILFCQSTFSEGWLQVSATPVCSSDFYSGSGMSASNLKNHHELKQHSVQPISPFIHSQIHGSFVSVENLTSKRHITHYS